MTERPPSGTEPRTLESLPAGTRRFWGAAMIVVGALTMGLVLAQPAQLRVPLWVAGAACGAFVVAGAAVALHASISARAYAWWMVVLLAVMVTMPLWIAFGSGARMCSASVPWLAAGVGCRVGFGVAAVMVLGMLGIAVRRAVRLRG